MSKSRYSTKTMVTLAMLTALAYAVMVVCKIIPPIAGILSLEVKATVIAIGGFIFGPLASLCMSIVVSFLEFFTVSDTGPYGLIMNILADSSFACTAVYIYRRRHTTSAAVVGLVSGVGVFTLLMLLWNYIITPLYFRLPREAVVAMLPTVILPFNLVKGILNSALIMLLYPPVVAALRRAGLVAPSQSALQGQPKRKFNYGPTIVAALVLITGILLALAMLGIL